MSKKRRKFTKEFKSKVALEALREYNSIPELAQKYKIHPTQVRKWKQQALQDLHLIFGDLNDQSDNQDQLIASLYEKIGRLEMQLDWLKKNPDSFK